MIESLDMIEPKDIFISYKNDYIGSLFASQLRDNLEAMRYSVYFNPHEKKADDFPKKLRNAVSACTDLLLIVSPGCLEQLIAYQPVDWIREEVLIARELKKNIVPILIGGAQFPEDNTILPEKLRFLPKSDYIVFPQAPDEYYDGPFSRLTAKFIHSKPGTGGRYRGNFASNPRYDVVEDMKRLRAEAEAGSLAAKFELGMMYYYGFASETGNTVKRDYAEAGRLMKEIAATENEWTAHAKNILAHLCYCGEMPAEKQSYRKAFEYHSEASEGDIDSAAQRAFQLSIGCGCEFDFETTEAYYRSIIEKGDDIARMMLAELYMKYGDFRRAAEQYEHMAELSPDAAYNLGMLYKRGVLNDPPQPDYVYAAYYLGLASEVHPQAAFELGMIYFQPCGKVIRKDFRRAEHYFKIAAEHGVAAAQYDLGFMYDHGHVEKNLNKAIEYYEAAASQGHSLSAAELARLYQLEGENTNYNKAFHYASIAAAHGVAEAAFTLGNLLFLGRGCEPDLSAAQANYEFAFEHGIYAARVMMDKIRQYR